MEKIKVILYERLFRELHSQGIHYLVAGGFAVNFHQVQRATVDLDLIIHLESKNILSFVQLMNQLGYKPRLPVKAEDLADEKKRNDWIKNKNMKVFSFINPKLHFETIDIFVEEPMPFSELDSRKYTVKAFGVTIPVVGFEDLIAMKEATGREKDIFDVSQLKKKREHDDK